MDNEERVIPSVKLTKEEFELKLLLLGFTPWTNGYINTSLNLFLEEYKRQEFLLWNTSDNSIIGHWPSEFYEEIIEHLGNDI